MNSFFSKIFICFLCCTIVFFCSKSRFNNVIVSEKDGFKIYDFSLSGDEYIIIPKNQTNGQSLSVIIKDKNDDLIVFDGGRLEDAEHLTDIINNYGGKVKAWYLTHIHDDHIGALYKILKDKKINIDMLYYDFADFDWYYDKMGDDAGIVLLFEDALNEYMKIKSVNVVNDFHAEDKYNSFSVNILNNIYELDSDPINNSSIVYKIMWKDASMIILGDLAYDGGKKLKDNIGTDVLKSDIVVLAHHGQNGVDDDIYRFISPKIAIWPTSKDIYENVNGKFDTEVTKKCLDDIGVRYSILSYESDSIIK